MYSLEELKSLGFFVLAAIVGRMLFYRALALEGNFRQKIKIRFYRLLWELPVIAVIGVMAFEAIVFFDLNEHSGVAISIGFGYVGIEAIKIWLDDYLSAKIKANKPGRRDGDEK